MTTLGDLQNMFNQGNYLFSERNDSTFGEAQADLRHIMQGEHQPSWLAVIYSSVRGLVFVMRGPDQPQVMRYMTPYYIEAAWLIVEVAGIHIPGHSQSKLGRLFGSHTQVALTELGFEPKVSIAPGLDLPVPPH